MVTVSLLVRNQFVYPRLQLKDCLPGRLAFTLLCVSWKLLQLQQHQHQQHQHQWLATGASGANPAGTLGPRPQRVGQPSKGRPNHGSPVGWNDGGHGPHSNQLAFVGGLPNARPYIGVMGAGLRGAKKTAVRQNAPAGRHGSPKNGSTGGPTPEQRQSREAENGAKLAEKGGQGAPSSTSSASASVSVSASALTSASTPTSASTSTPALSSTKGAGKRVSTKKTDSQALYVPKRSTRSGPGGGSAPTSLPAAAAVPAAGS